MFKWGGPNKNSKSVLTIRGRFISTATFNGVVLLLLPLALASALAVALASAASVAPAFAPALALTPALAFALLLLVLLLLLLLLLDLLLLFLLLLMLLLCSEDIWENRNPPPDSESVLKGRDDFAKIRPNVCFIIYGCV